ncbi:MAG: phage-shock protein [Candidatus Hydrogenedentes bacterium]|nr:phage-shock protein [Candidatus Hydrogenedentota bacterium]
MGEWIGIIAVAGFFATAIIAVLGGLCIAALKTLRGGPSRKGRVPDMEETQLIQQIYHGLNRMEQRVESLETILLERERKGVEK